MNLVPWGSAPLRFHQLVIQTCILQIIFVLARECVPITYIYTFSLCSHRMPWTGFLQEYADLLWLS